MIHQLLRRDDLCPEDDWKICPDAPDDVAFNEPDCRCSHCPVLLLDIALSSLLRQRLIKNAFDICSALDSKFTVDWRELPADEFAAVGIIISERNKWQEEQYRKEREES